MKIKQTRQVRLDELIKSVWVEGIKSKKYRSNKANELYFDADGWITFDCACVTQDELFTITEEVEITEETKLNVYEIYHYGNNDFNATTHFNISVNKVLNMGMKESLFIYLQNEDGSIGELIWTKERGLIV